MTEKKYTWIPFYEELADKLLVYKNDRKSLIEKVKKAHKDMGVKFPKVESDNNNIPDMDPFTVFALFNRGSQNVSSRLKICEGYKKEFDMQTPIPSDFVGVPMYFYSQYCFYRYVDDPKRNDDCFRLLWNLFEKAVVYANDKSTSTDFEAAFTEVMDLSLIGESKLTMGLFHARPNVFVSLDKYSTAFISAKLGIKGKNISGGDYLALCSQVAEYASNTLDCSLAEFSDRAYSFSKSQETNGNEWYPALDQYDPGISKDDWLALLNNKNIIGPIWGGTLAAFYEMGGSATCTQIAERYNKTSYSISGTCTQIAKRVHKETDCPLHIDSEGNVQYWPILFQGKDAGSLTPGTFIWKLRPELSEALKEFNIMRYQWKVTDEAETCLSGDRRYWWLNANPKIWNYSDIAVGKTQSYTLYNKNGNKRRIFQNFLDAKVGDVVIGYESTPVKQIKAILKVDAASNGQEISFKKLEGLSSPIDYQTIKDCPELQNMEYLQNQQGSLFKLTKEEYDFLIDMIREENPIQVDDSKTAYAKADFLKDVYMTEDDYSRLVGTLNNKLNVILQGPPGVGKTFAATRLAYSIMGEEDDSRIEFVQFHQNYSYEDFMMGYKPTDEGFELKYGIFYRFCQKAANQPDKKFFFVIDEINRGNLSKIFGELLMLIEKDYRKKKITLAYNGMPFSVPDNLYIIGMMNTADRSLAMIDYALRRRFSFFDMKPQFASEGFKKYQESLKNETFDRLIEQIEELNRTIEKDKSLGKGFMIGHSYFCGQTECTDKWMRSVIDYDIIPMLSEYWFDDENQQETWKTRLYSVLK